MNARSRTPRRQALGMAAALAWVLAACQLVLGTEGGYRCKDNTGCPSSLACASESGACVMPCSEEICAAANATCSPATQTCTGSMPITDAGMDPETSEPETGPTKPFALGLSCGRNDDCVSNFCADGRYLAAATQAITGPICSKACCTSGDCGPGLACQANGKGARFCVTLAGLKRSTQGSKTGGDACTTGRDCLSGLCQNTKCVDTCCDATQCAAGTVCKFEAVDAIRGWHCLKPIANGTNTCIADNLCQTNLCLNSKCRVPCCKDTQCGGGFCTYEFQAVVKEQPTYCLGAGAAGNPSGASCANDTECISGLCDDALRCARICCVDGDCGPGKSCKPDAARSLMRCVTN
jgi:hypothetical protein